MNEYEWSKIPPILKTGQFLQNMVNAEEEEEEEQQQEEVKVKTSRENLRFLCPCALESFTEVMTSVHDLVHFVQTLQAFCVDNIAKQLSQNKTGLSVLFNMSKEWLLIRLLNLNALT